MDNKTFKIGEYKGNTYQHVRINHPEYFLKLVCLPAGNVTKYFDFITYCIGYLTIEVEDEGENEIKEATSTDTSTDASSDNEDECSSILHVYTDGACANNGRPNARAGLGIYFGENHPWNVSKPVKGKQTNNVAEISAVIEAYDLIRDHASSGAQTVIHTDSEYVLKCVGSYGEKQATSGWKKTIPNKELVRKAYETYLGKKNIIFEHVKAHTNKTDRHSLGNHGADHLANLAAVIN